MCMNIHQMNAIPEYSLKDIVRLSESYEFTVVHHLC